MQRRHLGEGGTPDGIGGGEIGDGECRDGRRKRRQQPVDGPQHDRQRNAGGNQDQDEPEPRAAYHMTPYPRTTSRKSTRAASVAPRPND
jgi:hypothetical protein